MKIEIKRSKQPDRLEYKGKLIEMSSQSVFPDIRILFDSRGKSVQIYLSEAKELSKVLPKFLEEMERTK